MADGRRRQGSVVTPESRVYISGPITGWDLAERRKTFAKAAKTWAKRLDMPVVNPLALPHNRLRNRPWEFYIRMDILVLVECDHFVLLKGWEKSRGSKIELQIAQTLAMTVLCEDGALPCDNWPTKEEVEHKFENPKDLVGTKKVPLQLVPPIAAALEALVMGHGAAKYGPWNWREKKIHVSEYVAATKRHMDSFWDGEDLDVGTPEKPGSLLPHLAHARATLGVLMDAIGSGMVVDDRPKNGGAAAKLIREHAK